MNTDGYTFKRTSTLSYDGWHSSGIFLMPFEDKRYFVLDGRRLFGFDSMSSFATVTGVDEDVDSNVVEPVTLVTTDGVDSIVAVAVGADTVTFEDVTGDDDE